MSKDMLMLNMVCQQRNGAMDALADQAATSEILRSQVQSRHELLAQVIRSGQVPQECVADIMKDEVFAAWYKKTHSPA
jgi:hypothetical protein